MITIVVYFHGPQTDWSGVIADREIIGRHDVPFLWLARMKARSIISGLNMGRCGYALLRGEEVCERHEATTVSDPGL